MSTFKTLFAGLLVLTLALQWRLWIGTGSLAEIAQLEASVDENRQNNRSLEMRNETLEIEITELRDGLDTVEEIAREELGMISTNETFLLLVENSPD